MKRLTDLTSYAGVLPYASEVFGIYQPLLGWRSRRIDQRIQLGADTRLAGLLQRLLATLQPDFTVHYDAASGVSVDGLAPALSAAVPTFGGIVTGEVSKTLPPHGQYKPDAIGCAWDE